MSIQKQKLNKALKTVIDKNHIEMLEDITNYMDINYSVMDIDGKVVMKNEAFLRRFPNLNEASGLEVWEHCKQVMKDKKRVTIEEEYEDKIYLSIKQPLIEENNKCKGVMVLSFDITAQKEAEIVKKRFLTSINHDINTPFMGLWSMSEMLAKNEPDEKKKRSLLLINRAAGRLKDYLEKILSFVAAKDDSPDKKMEFNLKDSFQNIVDMMMPALTQKNLAFDMTCPDKKVRLHKFNMEKIVLNLFSNAINFTDKGNINLNVGLTKNKLKIAVKDTGIGIAKKNQKFIFDEFERVIPSYDESSYRGCGLGLSIAKTLTEQMKGKISVESELNKGSVFTVEIPV